MLTAIVVAGLVIFFLLATFVNIPVALGITGIYAYLAYRWYITKHLPVARKLMDLKSLSPREFELAVAEILRRLGYKNVRVHRRRWLFCQIKRLTLLKRPQQKRLPSTGGGAIPYLLLKVPLFVERDSRRGGVPLQPRWGGPPSTRGSGLGGGHQRPKEGIKDGGGSPWALRWPASPRVARARVPRDLT